MVQDVTTNESEGEERPWLSIVSAVYGVAPYLPDFIRSIEAQGDALQGVEVILVDDGSVDGSGEIADEWARQRPGLVRVIHQENGGQSAARNTGAREARGTWITFPDPDDVLADNYLAEVGQFIKANPSASMVVSHIVFFREAEDALVDNHPLTYRFQSGNKLVDLDRFPDYFHLSLASSFLQLDVLRANQLEGDARVRPVGEDGHLVGRYLLTQDPPRLGLVDTAHYHYRKRADESSTIDVSRRNPDRYTEPLRYGLLGLVSFALERKGKVPEWLQNELIYELQWLLRPDLSSTGGAPGAAELGVGDEFHELLGLILAHVESRVVASYKINPLPQPVRTALAYGFREKPWHSSEVVLSQLDSTERWAKFTYRYVGDPPAESILVNGVPVRSRNFSRRFVEFAGRVVYWERTAWLPMRGRISFELDGAPMPIARWSSEQSVTALRARDIDRMFGNKARFASTGSMRDSLSAKIARTWNSAFGAQARAAREVRWSRRLANSWLARRIFGGAWVLMDRDGNAGDNAEHLFRYLRDRERSINAWFVIDRRSTDYRRLRREGYKRVVGHRTMLWRLLALNAKFLLSSHSDQPVHNPPELEPYGGPKWKFVFLQHGVTKDDISRWLNGKPIRLFVTSTRAEYEYISGDDSPFAYSKREVVRTGMPRLDRLARLGADVDKRNVVLVMPTWRQYLARPAGNVDREDAREAFLESDFVRCWSEFFNQLNVEGVAAEDGVRVVFMPHPNLQPLLAYWALPSFVEVASYDRHDVQELLAASRVVVTDYSSTAFDAASIRRPVVYFQFDYAEVFGGGHTTRPGYFDYTRDGFGPVVGSAVEAVKEVSVALERGGTLDPQYQARADQAFGSPDGKNCARVVKAVRRVDKAMRWK